MTFLTVATRLTDMRSVQPYGSSPTTERRIGPNHHVAPSATQAAQVAQFPVVAPTADSQIERKHRILPELSFISYLYGAAAAVLMGIAKTGVPGAAIPAVAFMAEAFPENTKLSVGTMLPLLIVGDIVAVSYYGRHTHWNRLAQLFPYVILGMIPGYLVMWNINSDGLRVALGGIVLGLLSLHVGRTWFGWEKIPEQWWFTAITGMLAGFGTVLGNAAGPVMSVYLVSKGMDKHEFIGTAAWFFFIVNLSKIPFFLLLGNITVHTLRLDFWLVPALLIGALSGVVVLKRIPQSLFNTLVLALAAVAALRLIFG
jgi:uncharacterized membrane protein YfcA